MREATVQDVVERLLDHPRATAKVERLVQGSGEELTGILPAVAKAREQGLVKTALRRGEYFAALVMPGR
jgi:hypothetical protein